MASKLITQRQLTSQESKQSNAEIIFEREDYTGRVHTIHGCSCYESWQQWGAPKDILWDNVEDIEKWRKTK